MLAESVGQDVLGSNVGVYKRVKLNVQMCKIKNYVPFCTVCVCERDVRLVARNNATNGTGDCRLVDSLVGRLIC